MSRDPGSDGLKFIMIFLVVLGHLKYNDYGLEINKVIYAFHMPVFVFLSGFFTSLTVSKAKQNQWLKKTLVIYAIAQLAHFLLAIVLGYVKNYWNHEPFDDSVITWRVFISPYLAMWYLVCLIFWRWAVWNCPRGVDDVKLLVGSVILAIVAGFIPLDNEFAFQRIFAFFPFFALGLVFKRRNWMRYLNNIPMRYAVVALLLGLVLASYLPLYFPKYPYRIWVDALCRLCQSMLGVYLCLLIVRVSRIRAIESFAQWGTCTLWIYVGHTYLIVIGKQFFPHYGLSFNLFTALILAAVYCGIFIVLAHYFRFRR